MSATKKTSRPINPQPKRAQSWKKLPTWHELPDGERTAMLALVGFEQRSHWRDLATAMLYETTKIEAVIALERAFGRNGGSQ